MRVRLALMIALLAVAGGPHVTIALTPLSADCPAPPQLPLAQWWSVELEGPVSAGPVSNGARVYLAYASGWLVAFDAADGHELWRQNRRVTLPMVAASDLLFVSSGDAIEALSGATGVRVWILPRTTTNAPLVSRDDWLIATTDAEVFAIHAVKGGVVWRHSARGVTLAPAIDDGRVFTGAKNGRVLALRLTDGAQLWDSILPGGITALAADRGRVLVGAGDKHLYSLDGVKDGRLRYAYRLGAAAIGHIAADDERIYVASMDNVVRAFDADNGNQRWPFGLHYRPTFGVFVSGHIVFAPAVGASELLMIYDHNGGASGRLVLPGETPPGLAPAIVDSAMGPIIFAVTGGLTNQWHLTKFAPAGDPGLVPFAALTNMPGVPFLTDPELKPLGTVLGNLILGDPPLVPFTDLEWPVVLKDPPLVPLTTLPGQPLRPLSPVLPVRRAAPRQGG